MVILMHGVVDDVDSYEGKNGWGATITLSNVVDKRRKSISFNTKDKEVASEFEANLQHQVEVKIVLEQNNFGLRLGQVIEIKPLKG